MEAFFQMLADHPCLLVLAGILIFSRGSTTQ